MILSNKNDYFSASTYIGYIFNKLKKGGLWNTVSSIYKKIRKYTLISGIIRTLAIIIALLEKSALLLLLATAILLFLPAVLIFIAIFVVICIIKYLLYHKQVYGWLKKAERITVYLSSEKIFEKRNFLFVREAAEEASKYTHPVIAVCSDPFVAARWYSLNLLAVKPDYFFLLKKHYFSQKRSKITYIVVS